MAEKDSAIDKALDILITFIPHNAEKGTLEISDKLGFHKATASRILLTLARRGFLQQDGETKKFRLGRASLDLGRAVIDSLMTNLVQLAKPHIDRLRTEIQATVVFEQMVNDRAVISYVSQGPQRVRVAGEVGDYVCIYAAAGAKAMLAFSEPAAVERVIQRAPDFHALTPNTIANPDHFMQHLREIRRSGYSLDNEEIDIGVKAIGMPVFDFRNIPIAALAVVFPSHRLGDPIDPAVLAAIKKAAETISAVLLMVNVGSTTNS
jgi:IclR family KDG regulon transcriptional repressor